MKLLRVDIIALVLAAVFSATVYLFLSAYNRNSMAQERLEAVRVRLRIIEDQKNEVERKKNVLVIAHNFLEKARALGLADDNWTSFGVNLEQPVYFSDLAQYVNQCTHNSTHYFRPEVLHLKTATGAKAEALQDESAEEKREDNVDDLQGDLLLKLKGAFMVRQK